MFVSFLSLFFFLLALSPFPPSSLFSPYFLSLLISLSSRVYDVETVENLDKSILNVGSAAGGRRMDKSSKNEFSS